MKARRDQYIEAIDDYRCNYYTTTAFNGFFTCLIVKTYCGWIKHCFDSVAHTLQARTESLAEYRPAAVKAAERDSLEVHVMS